MLNELSTYKEMLFSILSSDDRICRALLGEYDASGEGGVVTLLKPYLQPHLYLETGNTEPKSCLCFETYLTKAGNSFQDMKLVVQILCHKDMLEYNKKPDTCCSLRYDVLARYIEEDLCGNKAAARSFGVGALTLDSADILISGSMVGRVLTFLVPAFRRRPV